MINLKEKLHLLQLVRKQTDEPDAVLRQTLQAALVESNAEQLKFQILSGPKASEVIVVYSGSTDVIHREEPFEDAELTEALENGRPKNRPFFHRGKWILPIFDSRLVGFLSFSFSEKELLFPIEKDVFQFYSELILLSLQKGEDEAQIDEKAALKSMAQLGEMSYDLAHRIGNDLGLISWWLRSIKEKLGDPDQVEEIKIELNKIEAKIKKVMSWGGRLRDDFLKTRKEEAKSFDLEALFGVIKEKYEHLPHATKLTVLPLPIPIAIFGIPALVMNILFNLVDNAVQAMPSGGTILIKTCIKNDHVQIFVRDNGPGIPEAIREKIFHFMFSTKESSGFGLWSAARNAKILGGSLELEKSSDRGSTFVLTLPVCSDQKKKSLSTPKLDDI